MSHHSPDGLPAQGERSLLYEPGTWVLIAVVLFFYCAGPWSGSGLHQGEKAKVQAAATQIAQFREAVQLYAVDNGHPPSVSQGLDALIHPPKKGPKPKHWKKYLPDLNEIPMDPWGDDYVYQFPSPRGEPFLILSCGPDGKPGTKDDITSGAPRRDAW